MFIVGNFCACVFCRDQTLVCVKGILMAYNDSSKQWLTCGNHPFVSMLYLLYTTTEDSYRFVAINEHDGEASACTLSLVWSQINQRHSKCFWICIKMPEIIMGWIFAHIQTSIH